MSVPELIVLSHLRWTFVWQRPQHIVSRLSRDRRTWFVEEPLAADVAQPRMLTADQDGLTRAWLEIPDPGRHVSFGDDLACSYASALSELLDRPPRRSGQPLRSGHAGQEVDRVVWLYTPLALDIALALKPTVLVYDVMDDLASFKDAPRDLIRRQRQALQEADVVFAGGRSLYRSVLKHRRDNVHLFPSGVEPEHYEKARSHGLRGPNAVAGYVGVIDERLDLDLIGGLARRLPDWEIRMVGPVAKIDQDDLPKEPNITYLGNQPYGRLPEIMGGFDVALMPFALNEATRSISPTKTLEYLAAGLPVVSTRVPDVVADFETVVDLQDDAAGFADACRRVRLHDLSARDRKLRPLLYEHHWDTIAGRMGAIVASAPARSVLGDQVIA